MEKLEIHEEDEKCSRFVREDTLASTYGKCKLTIFSSSIFFIHKPQPPGLKLRIINLKINVSIQQLKQNVKRSHSSNNADTAKLWEYLKTSSFNSIKELENGHEHRAHETNYACYRSSNDPSYTETGELLSLWLRDWCSLLRTSTQGTGFEMLRITLSKCLSDTDDK